MNSAYLKLLDRLLDDGFILAKRKEDGMLFVADPRTGRQIQVGCNSVVMAAMAQAKIKKALDDLRAKHCNLEACVLPNVQCKDCAHVK